MKKIYALMLTVLFAGTTFFAQAQAPSLKFSNLEDGGTYAAPIFLQIDIENFKLADANGEGDGYLKFESPIIDDFAKATGLDTMIGLKNPVYCDEFVFLTMALFPIEVEPGTYTITASLADMDSLDLNPAVAQTVTVTIAEPAIQTSAPNDTLAILAPNQPAFLNVTGVVLSDSIYVSCSDSLFQITKENSIALTGDSSLVLNPNENNILSVLYVGDKEANRNAELTLVSGEISKTIVLSYVAATDTVAAPIYTLPNVNVYPNPATTFVQVELGEAQAQNVEVISMNGQLVYSAANQGNNFTISFSECTKGVYFIRIITSDNQMMVKKVIKM